MAVNVFLRFADPAIIGESTDAKHLGEIQVLSWSHSFNQPSRPATGADEVVQATHSDFTFSKYLDSATDDLLRHCWNGARVGSAEMSCYRSDGDDPAILYLRVVMNDVVVSNISIGGGPGDLPTENVSLTYNKVAYFCSSQKDAETQAEPVSHDLVAHVVE